MDPRRASAGKCADDSSRSKDFGSEMVSCLFIGRRGVHRAKGENPSSAQRPRRRYNRRGCARKNRRFLPPLVFLFSFSFFFFLSSSLLSFPLSSPCDRYRSRLTRWATMNLSRNVPSSRRRNVDFLPGEYRAAVIRSFNPPAVPARATPRNE